MTKAAGWIISALLACILALGSGAGWLIGGRLERIEIDHGSLTPTAKRIEDIVQRLDRLENKLDRVIFEGKR